MTATTNLPTTEQPHHKRGADGGFFAVVCSQHAEDAINADMAELRALADSNATRDSCEWLPAISLLRDIDALDQQERIGLLDAEAYHGLVEQRFRATPIEPWLCAAGVARLVARLLAHRRLQLGTSQQGPQILPASIDGAFTDAGMPRARRR
jgi:hypothetical protein